MIGKNPYVVKLIGFRKPEKYLLPVIWFNFALTAFILSLYGILFACSMYRHFSLNHFKALSYTWQPLIAAAFAISAAAMGVAAIQYQTHKSEESEEGKRKRRANALAATFTLALSELSNYASECALINASLFTSLTGEAIRSPGLQFPLLPNNLTREIADLIEVSQDDYAFPLIALVRRVQIFNARISDVQRRATGPVGTLLLPLNVVGRVIDAAEIYARAGILMGHIRRAAPSPADPVTFADVSRALLIMPAGILNFQVYQDEIERRFLANGSNPEWPEL